MNIKTTQTKSDLLKNVKRLKEKPTKFCSACCGRFANSFVTKHCSRKTNNVGSSRERLVKTRWIFLRSPRRVKSPPENFVPRIVIVDDVWKGREGQMVLESLNHQPPSRPIIVEWTDTYLFSRWKSPRWRASHRTGRISTTAIWN